MDAVRDGRAAARRQGAGRPRCPARPRAGAGGGRCRPRRPTYDAACRGPPGSSSRSTSPHCPPYSLVRCPPRPVSAGTARSTRPRRASALGWVLSAVRDAGAEPWVHCCAAEAPLALLRGAGAVGLAVDLSLVGADGHDALAEALEAGETVALGVVPTQASSSAPSVTAAGRAGAPLARPGRPRPGRGRLSRGRLADLRSGRRRPRVGTPGARAQQRGGSRHSKGRTPQPDES